MENSSNNIGIQNSATENSIPRMDTPCQTGDTRFPAQGTQPHRVNSVPYVGNGQQVYNTPYGGYGHPMNNAHCGGNSQPSPSAVYYNCQQGSTPQYHYGNPTFNGVILNQYYHEQNRISLEVTNLKRRVKSAGNAVGGAALLCLAMSYVFSFVFSMIITVAAPGTFISQIANSFLVSVAGSSVLQILYTLLVVGFSFFVVRNKISDVCLADYNVFAKASAKQRPLRVALNKPMGGGRIPLVILIGFGGCLLANFVCIILSVFYTSFGFTSGSSSSPDPQSMWDIMAMFCSTAIIPALIEELALRGFVMGPLRKFGDGFAVVFSAFIFGIFHGDMDQIPFAFICGLFMGYAVVVTESLWTGVIIHAMNNSISCVQSMIIMYQGEDAGGSFFLILSAIGIFIGAVALVMYMKKYRKEDFPKLGSKNRYMKTYQLLGSAMASPAVIVATVLFALEAIIERLPVR